MKPLIMTKELIEFLLDLILKGMKSKLSMVVLILSVLGLSACGGGSGGGGADSSLPVVEAPSGVPVVLTLKTGNGFECLIYSAAVFCRGVSANSDIGLNTASFVPLFEDSDSAIRTLRTWDDTICVESSVLDRPRNGGVGLAVYCIGEASLNGNSGDPRIVYSGPMFSVATHGSPDVTFSRSPFMGGDFDMVTWIAVSAVTDGVSHVSETEISCSVDAGETAITCPNFEVNL